MLTRSKHDKSYGINHNISIAANGDRKPLLGPNYMAYQYREGTSTNIIVTSLFHTMQTCEAGYIHNVIKVVDTNVTAHHVEYNRACCVHTFFNSTETEVIW